MRFFVGAAAGRTQEEGGPEGRAYVSHHQPRAIFEVDLVVLMLMVLVVSVEEEVVVDEEVV